MSDFVNRHFVCMYKAYNDRIMHVHVYTYIPLVSMQLLRQHTVVLADFLVYCSRGEVRGMLQSSPLADCFY